MTQSIRKTWSASEENSLRRLYASNTAAQLAPRFGCTPLQVYDKAKALGLKKSKAPMSPRKVWTPAEIDQLRQLYPDTIASELAIRFTCTLSQVYRMANTLGLEKSAEFKASAMSGRLDGIKGEKTRFQKGGLSWNKDKKGWESGGNSAATRFKKGARPQTWVPVGSIVTDPDGYQKKKISDNAEPGKSRHNWKFLHVLEWEEHNGPVPRGHAVVFRDGNRQNITIENLELITRTELMRRNTIHNYPAELKDTMRLLGKVKRIIKKRSEASHEKQD